MQTILGVIPKNNYDFTKILSKNCTGNVTLLHNTTEVQFCVCGIKSNLFYSRKNKWLVSGIGLSNKSQNFKILNQSDWENLLNQKDFDDQLKQLNGHFIVITWSNNKVSFYSDVLGLREISLLKTGKGVFFSTDVTRLSKFSDLELNFYEFGSRWMLFNQISDRSIFKNVIRVVGGKTAKVSLDENNISINDYNWLPTNSQKKFGVEEYSYKLASLINLSIPDNHHLSLSLSGGMDSRVILSFLLKNNLSFDTHTFGDPNHPDSLIAKKLAEQFKLKHEQINLGLADKNKIIRDISEYTSQTLVNNAASSVIQLQNYRELYDRNIVLVDGGFGEIWRREFFYKLFLRGKDAVLKKAIQNIIPHLKLHRADIFKNDFVAQMEKGIEIQLDEIFTRLPETTKNDLGNWLDLFAIKTRITNYYSHEQARLDNNLISIMPFLQPCILKELFNMPVSLRQNGKLYRKIIKSNFPALGKFPLAKGQLIHPYFMNSLQSRLWSVIQKKAGLNRYKEQNSLLLLDSLKEFIYDMANSRDVKETPYYDISKIRKIIDGYYAGDKNFSTGLDWWLSFELFRQEYKNNNFNK